MGFWSKLERALERAGEAAVHSGPVYTPEGSSRPSGLTPKQTETIPAEQLTRVRPRRTSGSRVA